MIDEYNNNNLESEKDLESEQQTESEEYLEQQFESEEQREEERRREDRRPISRQHKIAAGVLVVFGIFVFITWVVQLKNNISAPFAYKESNQNQQNNVAIENNNDEALKTKDSDKDGLSDYDELNMYKTSPYLADSDSDGINDKQEIDNNKDPNCPVGRNCGNSGIVSGDQAVVNQGEVPVDNNANNNNLINNQLNNSGNTQPIQQTGTSSGSNVNNINLSANGSPDAATLRQLLLQNGMQKDVLDKISDKDLLDSYEETLKNSSQ